MEPRAKLLIGILITFLVTGAGAYLVGRHDGSTNLKPQIQGLERQIEAVQGEVREREEQIASLEADIELAGIEKQRLLSMNKLDLAVRACIARNFGIADRYIGEAVRELEVSLADHPALDTVRELAGLIPLDPRASRQELSHLVEVIGTLEAHLMAPQPVEPEPNP